MKFFWYGFISGMLVTLLRWAYEKLRPRLQYLTYALNALPDGTRVRVLAPHYAACSDVWTTRWSMRGDFDGRRGQPNDYHLRRQSNGETTYALRHQIEVVR